jgi:phthiocerol/phenolphthiocerol synthesis type-I polyketide synthase C
MAAIIGRSCRLPGAPGVEKFWQLLDAGQCAVRPLDSSRWSLKKYHHPARTMPGRTYAPAAALLDNIFDFDTSVFGISPREAEQMDPQQRLALELVWEALEEAGIPASSLAGTEVGVFVGSSALDHTGQFSTDPSSLDAYFATGNTLSIIANRISYIFDLHGPSFTVDTACSSALVAMHEALESIRSGRVDTAIVVGVNILLGPLSFIGFAQANMLSAQGLCRAFDASADGYVRGEGGVAFVLQREDVAVARGQRIHAKVIASGINQDGRTVGMSLPSVHYQKKLLERLYTEGGLNTNDVAFVEAHGTGTRVGDPAEAQAVGEVIGQTRSRPLPIGSAKSNVGHLEPASGLVGVLKAMLALEHNRLPATLHVDELNPDINFHDLNLKVAQSALALPRGEHARLAGINSFGFGGTNAHIVLSDADRAVVAPNFATSVPQREGAIILPLSAATPAALAAQMRIYASRINDLGDSKVRDIASAAFHARDSLDCRAVFSAFSGKELLADLQACTDGSRTRALAEGRVVARNLPVAFVYTGNGSQWAGMGRKFHECNNVFRTRLDETDALFAALSGWSLREALFSDDLGQRLNRAETAQPLLFALQVAATAALQARGLFPMAVFGHSVGEVAAAEASGALSLHDAVRVIHARSVHQEIAFGAGTMAAARLSADDARALIDSEPRCAGLEVAAINSSQSVTISGSRPAIEALVEIGRQKRCPVRVLDLEYPFHSALIEGVRAPLLAALTAISPRDTTLPFISTVTGKAEEGPSLHADYWWRNVRAPVQFADAMATALEHGARAFVEIGPRAILQSYIRESLAAQDLQGAVLSCTDHDVPDGIEPVLRAVAAAHTAGAAVDKTAFAGAPPLTMPDLPLYPWQRQRFTAARSVEARRLFGEAHDHPLIGERINPNIPVWFADIDTHLAPAFNDHVVSGTVVVPGAALVEMALAAGRQHLGTLGVSLHDFEILHALTLENDSTRSLQVRLSPESCDIEILSRPRLQEGAWMLHAKGRIAPLAPSLNIPQRLDVTPINSSTFNAEALYARARTLGLDFGPAFRRLSAVKQLDDTTLRTKLTPRRCAAGNDGYDLHPTDLDGAFQTLIALMSDQDIHQNKVMYLPCRLGEIRLFSPLSAVTEAVAHISRFSNASILADFELFDAQGNCVAAVTGVRFKAAALGRPFRIDRVALHTGWDVVEGAITPAPINAEAILTRLHELGLPVEAAEPAEAALLFDVFAVTAAQEALGQVAGKQTFIPSALIKKGQIAASSHALFYRLLDLLERRGRLTRDGERCTLAKSDRTVSADLVMRTILADHPALGSDVLMANRMARLLPRLLREGEPALDGRAAISVATATHAHTTAPFAQERHTALAQAIGAIIAQWPPHQPLRVVQLGAGFGGLTKALMPLLDDPRVSLTVTDSDEAIVHRLSLAFGGHSGISFMRFSPDAADESTLPQHDLAVSADGLTALLKAPGSVSMLSRALTANALLLAVEPVPNALGDLLNAASPGWLSRSAAPEFPVSLARTPPEWAQELEQAGFEHINATFLRAQGPACSLILAQIPAGKDSDISNTPSARTIGWMGPARSNQLISHLQARGLGLADETATDLVCLTANAAPEDAVEKLVSVLDDIRQILPHAHSARQRIWLITAGADRAAIHEPFASAVSGFVRVAANEYKGLDLRVIDVDPALSEEESARRVAREILMPRIDREVHIGKHAVLVPRVRARVPAQPVMLEENTPVMGQRLGFGISAGLDELCWTPQKLPVPAAGEVAIDIKATGLNFRDVMWAMGLLPEEALEDGFAGPSLGLEASGIVAAIGEGVSHVRVGDHVMAFVAAGFSSRVVTRASAVIRSPKDITFEASATIPVAFITAYYAMIELARLKKGETILIHGGAGGVGLAALQLALWRGVKVISTAGNTEKRDLLKMLGAHHVLNSRDISFADAVMRITDGQGVDAVLNSLSGDAMEKSISLVKPFGRFLELGKRDYYANTRIGLRPFRRNVSYFGIDADQLFAHDSAQAGKWFGKVVELFNKGVLTPLPYRSFAAPDTIEAFRLMQQSGHVGKIVITPPAPSPIAPKAADFAAVAEGTHIVTGGLSGFGLATARWLAERGARYLVLLSRTGDSGDTAREAVASLEALGAKVRTYACDVADTAALETCFEDVRATLPPIKGIVHAAMVLDDGLLANLDPERMRAVLAPKVAGAENLDRLTASDSLDYFVVYSSVTTVIGNPGQANYVAANAYLEGLARRRRSQGRPALAVAWGALSDVGYLARQEDVRGKLARRLGTHALTAHEALQALGVLLSRPSLDPASAVVAVAPLDWASARRELAVLASPAYAEILHDVDVGAVDSGDSIDLHALLAGKNSRQARTIVAELLGTEVARILKLPSSDIDIQKPLMQLGMDSLTALELRLNVEKRFNVDLPLIAMSDQTTLITIAAPIVARIVEGENDSEIEGLTNAEDALVQRHLSDDVSAADILDIKSAIEQQTTAPKRVTV